MPLPRTALLVGHITTDLRDGNKLPGGPPQYQIPVLQYFGYQVDVLTSCSATNPFLRYPDISIYNIESDEDTVFQFSSGVGLDDRQLTLKSRAADIEVIDALPRNYDVVIISAIAGELSRETMEVLAGLGKNSFIDLQSIVRRISGDGDIYHEFVEDDIEWATTTFSLVKASKSELKGELNNSQSSFLVITEGGKPIGIYCNNSKYLLPGEPLADIIDSTGSGDIFLAYIAANYDSANIDEIIKGADEMARKALQIRGVMSLNQLEAIRN